MAHSRLDTTSARCAASDLYKIVPGHLSVRVGDSSLRDEEIVKNLELRLSMRLLYYYNIIVVVVVVVVVVIVLLLLPALYS